VLNECMTYVVYPYGTARRGIEYLLGTYAGADKEAVAKICALPCRWAAVRKTYPPCVICPLGAYMLRDTEPFEADEPPTTESATKKRKSKRSAAKTAAPPTLGGAVARSVLELQPNTRVDDDDDDVARGVRERGAPGGAAPEKYPPDPRSWMQRYLDSGPHGPVAGLERQ
jgi:hypothetical protein